MRLLKPLSNGLHCANRKSRIAFHEFRPQLSRPGQNDALRGSKSCSGIVISLQRLCKAEEVAWMDNANDDLLTSAGHLSDFQATVQEQKEVRGRLSLFKYRLADRQSPRLSRNEQGIQFVISHLVKQRQGLDDRPIKLQNTSLSCHQRTSTAFGKFHKGYPSECPTRQAHPQLQDADRG